MTDDVIEQRKAKARERARKRYQENPAAQKEANRRYYAGYAERIMAKRREWKDRTYNARMLAAAKHRAQRDGLEFNITVEDIHIPETCPVLGIPIFARMENKSGPGPNSPSLDRCNNDLGYIKGNVCVISHRANGLKSNGTIEEIRLVLAYMEANQF